MRPILSISHFHIYNIDSFNASGSEWNVHIGLQNKLTAWVRSTKKTRLPVCMLNVE